MVRDIWVPVAKSMCYPGARVQDITQLLPPILHKLYRGLKRLYVVHVGSNDIGLASSEMLKRDFKVLIKTLKDSSKRPVISGPVPLLQQVQQVTCLTTVVERLLQLF